MSVVGCCSWFPNTRAATEPPVPTVWALAEATALLHAFDELIRDNDEIRNLMEGALESVTNPVLVEEYPDRIGFWRPYVNGERSMPASSRTG
jgi:hypothetical protein